MINSLLSHDDELQVNGAFANISLIASKVWAYDHEDKYRKLNQSLWLQNCKLCEAYNEKNVKTTRVRDVIPASRLANYGNYEYSMEREKMYTPDLFNPETWKNDKLRIKHCYDDDDHHHREPWMLKQVEECFIKLLSSPISTFSSMTKIQQFNDAENGKYTMIPYIIDDNSVLQLQSRVTSKHVKDLWYSSRSLNVDSTRRVQGSSTPLSFYDPRMFNDEHQATNASCSSSLKDEKFHKVRRHCGSADKQQRTEIRKKFQQSTYTLRNERNFNAKRTCVSGNTLYPVVTKMSTTTLQNAIRPIVPVLCPDVAEFFPKASVIIGEEEQRQGTIQFFPSSAEPSYKDELFPYNQAHLSNSPTFTHNTGAGLAIAVSHPTTVNTWIRAPHQWIHRVVPPIHIQVPTVATINHHHHHHPPIYSTLQPFCPTIVHRPLNLHEKMFTTATTTTTTTTGQPANTGQIPVYQRPAELYQESSQRRGKNNNNNHHHHHHHHQGVDFNNLILLTKNAMKARRNQSKNPQHASSFILESRQPNLKSETDVLQWLNKGYPKRAREFGTVNSLVSELARFEDNCDCTRTMATSTASFEQYDERNIFNDDATDMVDGLVINDGNVPIMMTKKRLYRDVLTNTASNDIIVETLLDKRYDELEQQAMEQYRTSEECLAIRYQELERQGLEQYRYGDSSSESIRALCSSTLCNERREDDDIDEQQMMTSEDNDTRINNVTVNSSSSGFVKHGFCNNSLDAKDYHSLDGDKAGPAATMERPLTTILRSDIKCDALTTRIRHQQSGTMLRCNENVDTRGNTVVTKSLTTLAARASIGISGLKNPIKGASGDKIEEQVKSSMNNNHRIMLSNVKKSMPSMMRKDAICEIPITSGYCNDGKITNVGIPSGGGDEKITILRSSPGASATQVWLSNFWR